MELHEIESLELGSKVPSLRGTLLKALVQLELGNQELGHFDHRVFVHYLPSGIAHH
jgi:hypothetical protein